MIVFRTRRIQEYFVALETWIKTRTHIRDMSFCENISFVLVNYGSSHISAGVQTAGLEPSTIQKYRGLQESSVLLDRPWLQTSGLKPRSDMRRTKIDQYKPQKDILR